MSTNPNNSNTNNNSRYRGKNKNNNSRRGQQGKDRNAKTHVGAISEIEVFDCASRKDIDRCADILKSIALYVGNNYGKNADLIKYVVEELEDPDLEDYKPKDIDTADQRDPLKMFVWKEEMKKYFEKKKG